MKNLFLVWMVVAGMAFGILAQDQKPASGAENAAPTMSASETKFKELLTNVIMTGRWTPVSEGKIGEEKEDKYTIVGASKVKDDSWVINAKMKYGEKEITMPFPVQVKFAGDTPVIVVDKMTIPGGGTYSARVLFFEKTYAGSWTGAKHGGLLSGTIVKAE